MSNSDENDEYDEYDQPEDVETMDRDADTIDRDADTMDREVDTMDRDADTIDREMADDYDPNPTERGKGLSAIVALLGLWMIVESILFDLVAAQFWNDLIVGVLLLAVGGYNYYRRADEDLGSVAAASVAAVLGLWLIAAPFLFGADVGFTEAANDLAFWNDIVVGLLALALGAYSAYAARDQRSEIRGTVG